VTGFIAKDADGLITTLGRGGSDLTATTLGAALGVEEVQVWKDVDGICTANPKLVKAAHPVGTATYAEASELAYFGAEVLHPRAMLPCQKAHVPVRVKNSYNPDAPGTFITGKLAPGQPRLRSITSKDNITMVDIVSTRMLGAYGFLAEIFNVFAEEKISVDMITTSEVSVSLTIDEGQKLGKAPDKLRKFADVEVKEGRSIITLVGEVGDSMDITEKIFAVCSKENVPVQMISQGASKNNISILVNTDAADRMVIALHKKFFEE
jgi:aspartate kinase